MVYPPYPVQMAQPTWDSPGNLAAARHQAGDVAAVASELLSVAKFIGAFAICALIGAQVLDGRPTEGEPTW